MSFRVACFFVLLCSLVFAQSTAENSLAFRSAIVKPSTPQTPLSGGPEWVATDRFDLVAEAGGVGRPTSKEFELMVQKLLAEGFKLTFHREQKELSVYALTVGPSGPKLKKSEKDPTDPPRLGFTALGRLPAVNASMPEFAKVMQLTVLDRPVVDQTGLAGKFDFDLNWAPDQTQFAGIGLRPSPDADGSKLPDLFTAIQSQLGLKLQPANASIEVFVIDGAEKPSGK
ncbi:MAG: TIGR03435 family protein [Bryobacteraceae bacterium]